MKLLTIDDLASLYQCAGAIADVQYWIDRITQEQADASQAEQDRESL